MKGLFRTQKWDTNSCLLNNGFRLSLWVLFYAHGLRSPAALQKLLHRFSAAYTLIQRIAKQKIRRKIFAAAARRRVYMASAALRA